jgi:hypothetical protein
MVLEGERHVVQVLDACPCHLDDAVALAHARTVGGPARTRVGQQHAARLLLHRPVVGHRPQIGAVSAAVAFTRGRGGGSRVDGRGVSSRHARGEHGRQLGDARRALRVEGGRLVLGAVVLLVRAREQMEHRNARRVEAGLVGGTVSIPAPDHLETLCGRGRVQQRVPLGRRLRAQHDELVVAQPAHHVQVDHGHGVRRRRGQGGHEARGSGEPDLLAREEGEHHRAVRRDAGQGRAHALGGQQHRHRARRVVVRAVVDGALVRPHGSRPAVAEVIVVRAHDDGLAGERPAAGHDPGDVLGAREGRPQRDAAGHPHRGNDSGARPQVAVHVVLEPPQVDTPGAQPPFGDTAAHLQDGNPGRALRSIVA